MMFVGYVFVPTLIREGAVTVAEVTTTGQELLPDTVMNKVAPCSTAFGAKAPGPAAGLDGGLVGIDAGGPCGAVVPVVGAPPGLLAASGD